METIIEKIPRWARDRIGYQCLVDTFAIGCVDIKNKAGLYAENVYGDKVSTLRWHECDEKYHYGNGYYGGDLNGISYAVKEYFNELGVDLLYLTPIFEAGTNHKYDSIDYKKIDKQFGTMEDFKRLVSLCKKNNIRLILDGVFNHSSSMHEWYLKANEGIKGYKDFYKRNREGYILFWRGVKTLPVLNHENEEVRKYLYESEDGVILFWLNEGIDGFRLDAAEELGKKPISLIRKNMKKKYPDSLLIGEIIDSYGKEWLSSGLLDGLMNYVFRGATVNFLTGKNNGNKYLKELTKMYNEYPKEKLYVSWNIISTHDTNRMLYDLDGDESLFKMAVILQFTYPGVPLIYYGDELGMYPGKKGSGNRASMEWDCFNSYKRYFANHDKSIEPMEWDKVNRFNSYQQFYKHIIRVRKNYTVFSYGDFIPLYSDNDAIAYIRLHENKAAFICVNRSNFDRNIKINIPKDTMDKSLVLTCVYGGNSDIDLSKENIEFRMEGRNSYLFVN
jgi:glycosidase